MCLANYPNLHLQADAEFDVFEENEEYDEVEVAEVTSEFIQRYRAKWLLDKCKSITDMIDKLHQEADRLATLRSEGWELDDEIADDDGLLVPPDLEAKVAAALHERAGGNIS